MQLEVSLSPITLIAQEFLRVDLTAIFAEDFGPGNIDVDREIYQDEEDPQQWTVLLTVLIQGVKDKSTPPYVGGIMARGFYKVHDEFPGDAEKLIRITGASMLYGAIREMIAHISARAPNGMINLPSVSFIEPEKPKPKSKPTKKKASKK